MRVLLVSTYELGHQPLHVAAPAAALGTSGHDVRCVDIAAGPLRPADLEWAEAVGFSVPMHTAMRLAVSMAADIRSRFPALPICFYGLYAAVSSDDTVGRVADFVIAGEYQDELIAWADRLERGTDPADEPVAVSLRSGPMPLPARDLLPGLDNYARLAVGGEERLVGYVEASRGCRHRCRHCPIPTVYDGRFRVVPVDAVLGDVTRLVDLGARHITFGDPDFLNGPHHARRVVSAVHEAFPELTFDITAKVEHILTEPDVWPEFAAAGLLFVVSAFEILNDRILRLLDKGHTAADATDAVHLLRSHGVEIRPSWLPFTPWTALDDIADILEFVATHDLAANVDPIQYTIRLLVPQGSLIADLPGAESFLGDYDARQLSYRWSAPDPRLDALQQDLAAIVEKAAANDDDDATTLEGIWAATQAALGDDRRLPQIPSGAVAGRPRLTEPWFC